MLWESLHWVSLKWTHFRFSHRICEHIHSVNIVIWWINVYFWRVFTDLFWKKLFTESIYILLPGSVFLLYFYETGFHVAHYWEVMNFCSSRLYFLRDFTFLPNFTCLIDIVTMQLYEVQETNPVLPCILGNRYTISLI